VKHAGKGTIYRFCVALPSALDFIGVVTRDFSGKSALSPCMTKHMFDVTRLLKAIGQGERHATAELLPLVYEEDVYPSRL